MTEPEQTTGSAIQARREQVKSFDRPERLNAGLSIKDEVANVRDTADTYKVYVPEWLIVFTSHEVGDAGRQQAEAHFAEKYHERVRDEDVRYVPASDALPADFPYRLQLRLPNIKGEFKYKELAEQFVEDEKLEGAQIVARNSRDEYAIKDYSVKKLPKAKTS